MNIFEIFIRKELKEVRLYTYFLNHGRSMNMIFYSAMMIMMMIMLMMLIFFHKNEIIRFIYWLRI